ncbi:MAG: AgmX/PglI C-terminal domain-containing protein [bacterium]
MKLDGSSAGRNASDSSSTNRIKIMQRGNSSPETGSLKKLPKQFRKRFYQGYEPRFVIILVSSLLLHWGVILYLSNRLPKDDKASITERVRNQFAKLLLEGKSEFPSTFEKFVEEGAEVNSNFNLLESFINELDNYDLPIDDLLNFSEATSLEKRGPSAETIRVNREMTAERRRRTRESLFEEVDRIGLLGVLTSGSGVVTYAEVADILQFADSTAGDLEKRLAFLTSLRVPRAGDGLGFRPFGKRQGPFLLAKSDYVSKPPSIRENRTYTANVHVNDFVEKLGRVKEVAVRKILRFEDVPSSYVLSSLSSRSTNGKVNRLTRDPVEVKKVVMSHCSAIQDCYTQALKSNPYINGKVVVRFVISPEGQVISATVVSSSINDYQMIECMLDRILRWNDFSPLHPSADNMAIKQTYVFGF